MPPPSSPENLNIPQTPTEKKSGSAHVLDNCKELYDREWKNKGNNHLDAFLCYALCVSQLKIF